ncbi:MAG TPA: acetyl-CoA carboxylase biotin carboxyl carrier protein subunit [Desulfobacteraceae bacterium]|nr:acetyl-CoA carboxylase biotin carboxyl carrier protein subunit [Desulfobacteraceae bacterium]
MKYQIRIQEKQFEVEILEAGDGRARVAVDGAPYDVAYSGGAPTSVPAVAAASKPAVAASGGSGDRPASQAATAEPGALVAPIPGIILKILVNPGEAVTAGQVVAVMEAMKMENNLAAERTGTVREVRVQEGGEVATGDVIMIIEAS